MSVPTLDFKNIWPTLGIDVDDSIDMGETMLRTESQPWSTTIRDRLPPLILGPKQTQNTEFDLRGELGRGGMGIVHLATQVALGRDVALKTTMTDSSQNSEDALLQEARVMGLIEHPNVVPVHLIGRDDDGRPVIVMKRVEGRTWENILREDPMNLDRHLDILMQACRAFEYAHDIGVIHRDIKPENVMVGTFGEVYVMDWGLAVSVNDGQFGLPNAKESTSIVGTPAYIAPEMTIGDGKRLAPSTDVYLLGGVLYEIVTGKAPHEGKSLFEVFRSSYEGKERPYPTNLPREMKEIIERAMALKNEDRYQTVSQFREALNGCRDHRHSVELTLEALERLVDLKAGLKGSSIDIYRIFGAARFGFEQALSIWGENTEASEGLQDALITMFGFEESHNNFEAASSLFNDIEEPDNELIQRLNKLKERVSGAAKELAHLRELRRDLDSDIGLAAKSKALTVFAFGWLPFIWVREWTLALGLESDAWPFFGTSTLFLPLMAIMTAVGWKGFRANTANRVLIKALWLLWTAGFFIHAATWFAGAPLHLGIASEIMMFAAALISLGMVLETRLQYAGYVFGTGAVVVMFLPDHLYAVYSLSGFVGSLAYAIPGLLKARKTT
jgi:serine/threonine protein kinase